MAPFSILRKRQNLVWEIKESFKYEKDSPIFSLMNSKWILKTTPLYCPGKNIPLSYAISLKNCSVVQSFEPFEVLTFLEDRRNHVQIHCSKLIVSSDCETLFNASLDSIHEKLPGLKIYDDVTIVCSFYPSTGLVLSAQNEGGSSLRIRHSLVWKTTKPTINQNLVSREFNFKTSKWKLEISLRKNKRFRPANFQIYLTACNGAQLLEPFEVKTFLEDRRSHVQFQCSSLVVSSSCEILYRASIDTIHEKLPGFKLHDDLAVVCSFGSPAGLALINEKGNDIETSLEGSQFLNVASSFQDSFLVNSSSINFPSLKFVLNLERLSEDFTYLFYNSFMADIQLKSGNDVIPAHKAILAARSEAFAAKIQQEVDENNSSIIEIKDIEPSVLRIFLSYIYSGKVAADLSADMLCKLYRASDKYVVPILGKLCSYYMTTHLLPDNFIKFLVLSDEYNEQELKDAIANFIIEKPGLTLNPDWINFTKEFPDLAIQVYQKYMEQTILK